MSRSLRDPLAVISPEAMLDDTVEVGPFAVIEPGVVIGAGSRVLAHAYICSGTTLGRDNVVHMGAVLGHEPQDVAYRGAVTRLRIGDRNVFREGCHVHRGTREGSETVIGNGCYLMSNSHVAHNCELGDEVMLATGATLGGHARLGAGALISGNAAVHQHTRVGRLALIRGLCGASKDVPPFTIVTEINVLRGVNVVGLRRAGLERQRIAAIRRAYRALFFRRQNLPLARQRLITAEAAAGGLMPEVEEMLAFIAESTRGVCSGPRARPGTSDSGGEPHD